MLKIELSKLPKNEDLFEHLDQSYSNRQSHQLPMDQIIIPSRSPSSFPVPIGTPFENILVQSEHQAEDQGAVVAAYNQVSSSQSISSLTTATAGMLLAPCSAHVVLGLNVLAAYGHYGSSVLHVKNINANFTHCDHLFALFGVYGNVQRVKIMFNKRSGRQKDSAAVLMSEPRQALLAIHHLDKTKLWGKTIKVIHSNFKTVEVPKDGQPDGGLTKDYDNSSLKKLGSEDFLTMYPPSPILHLSNIPATLGESDLREVFRNKEIPVEGFKFFEEDEKMALVEFRNVDDAIMAIVKLDNYKISETSHLRVAFSKPQSTSSKEDKK